MDEQTKRNPHEGHRARLKEKVQTDPEFTHMHDHEVLEFVLSLVIPRKDTNPIAHELIRMFGSLDSVLHATPRALKRCKNMTENACFLLSAMFPVVRRAMQSKDKQGKRVVLSNPGDCIEYMHKFFIGRREENACALFLDINYRLLYSLMKQGSPAEVTLEPKELTAIALREGATYVIVAHNHPTGDVTPSFADLDLSHAIYDALQAIEVQLIDHIVFADYDYLSFRRNNILTKYALEQRKKAQTTLSEDTEFRRSYLSNLKEFVIDYVHSTSEGGFKTVVWDTLSSKK